MKVFFKFSLLLLTIFASAKLCAQKPQGRHGQALIDSLVTELQKQKEDTAKVSLLSDISAGYKDLNADNGIKYGELAMVLATKLEWVKGQALSHIDIGVNIQNKSDYLKALDHYQQALKLYENINDKRGITDAMQNIGSVYSDLCDYPKALEYDLAALKGFDDIGYKDGIAMVKNNIGSVYILQGDYPKALEYYFSALKIHEASGNKNRIAGITGNIGNVYFSQKDYPKALEYYFKTLQMDEETGDKEGVARNIGNVALTYASQGNYAAAITNYHKALQLAEQTGYQHSIAWNLEALGETYIDLVTDTAARPAAKEIPGEESIPTNKATLVHLAIDNLQRSLAMGKELHIMDVVQSCYEYLSIAYKISGDYKLALEYSDKYRTIKDSVFSKENDENIVRMGVKNEYDKKAAEAKK